KDSFCRDTCKRTLGPPLPEGFVDRARERVPRSGYRRLCLRELRGKVRIRYFKLPEVRAGTNQCGRVMARFSRYSLATSDHNQAVPGLAWLTENNPILSCEFMDVLNRNRRIAGLELLFGWSSPIVRGKKGCRR